MAMYKDLYRIRHIAVFFLLAEMNQRFTLLFFYINLRFIAESCGIIIWFLCCQYINIKLRVCICIPNAKQMLDNAVYQTNTFVILHNASLPMQPMTLKFLLNINHRFRYTLLSYHWYNHSQWPELLLNGRRPHCLPYTHQVSKQSS